MQASRRGGGLGAAVVAFLMLFVAAPAVAQENIDAGKSPAELYRQDCAICHKSPYGMSKAGGLFGLEKYLRVHYTASWESAAAIARYLIALDRKHPERAKHAPSHRRAGIKTKPADLPRRKPAAAHGAAKVDAKASKADAKAKPGTKSEHKPAEAAAAPKNDRTKRAGTKPGGAKRAAAKSAVAKSAKPQAKPGKKND